MTKWPVQITQNSTKNVVQRGVTDIQNKLVFCYFRYFHFYIFMFDSHEMCFYVHDTCVLFLRRYVCDICVATNKFTKELHGYCCTFHNCKCIWDWKYCYLLERIYFYAYLCRACEYSILISLYLFKIIKTLTISCFCL